MSAPTAISGHCGGGQHHLCFGNAPTEDGHQWVYCACQEPTCLCHQMEAGRELAAQNRAPR